MGTSGARSTSSAFDHDPTTTITDAAAARFLRLLRFLRLDLPHWEANQSVQRTGASRHAEWRCGRPGWLAPVADLGVRFPDQDHQDCPRPSFIPEHSSTLAQPEITMIQTETEMAVGGGHGLLACGGLPGVPLIQSNHGGPANGSQPARRVAMPTPLAAGSRR